MDLSQSITIEQENKIFIYDDLLNNESSIRTYTSEEEKSENCNSSYQDLLSCQPKDKEVRATYEHPLYTIYEGGSSVSSGSEHIDSMMDNSNQQYLFTTQYLRTEADYQNYN